MRYRQFLVVLCCLSVVGWAAEFRAKTFAETPAHEPGVLVAPYAVAIDAGARLCYVLDSGLRRVTAFNLDGEVAKSWSLEKIDAVKNAAFRSGALLPDELLAVDDNMPFLLVVNRSQRKVEVIPLDTPGLTRTVQISDAAAKGAFALDATQSLLVAYIDDTTPEPALVIARETPSGKLTKVTAITDPANGQTKNLGITGFVCAPETGAFAVGLAQSGEAKYSFVRSWLVEGMLGRDGTATVGEKPHTTRYCSLLDQRGKVLDRFRALEESAGKQGFPAKPCVPLFTALAIAPDGVVISGGHSLDPFIRWYAPDSDLLHAVPRQAGGGQTVAVLATGKTARIFVTAPDRGHVEQLSLDGRMVCSLGRPIAYDLAQISSLAADRESVYAVMRAAGTWQLLRFTADGRFLWAQTVQPPPGLEKAQPLLAAPASDRVLIGWRLPGVAGVGWVAMIMEDGLPGLPFWPASEARGGTPSAKAGTSISLVAAKSGRVYALREGKNGPRLYAISPGGAFLQQFPTAVTGCSVVNTDGSLAWVQPDKDGLMLNRYSAQGAPLGMKRVPRSVKGAQLIPAVADEVWGWLTNTQSLLQFDETMGVKTDATVLTPEGERVKQVLAIAGDRSSHLYLAVPGRILSVTP